MTQDVDSLCCRTDQCAGMTCELRLSWKLCGRVRVTRGFFMRWVKKAAAGGKKWERCQSSNGKSLMLNDKKLERKVLQGSTRIVCLRGRQGEKKAGRS